MLENVHLVCNECQTVNRVAAAHFTEGPGCGKCKIPLLEGHVKELTGADFSKYINFEPVFAAAAQQLKLQACLFRVETEEEPELVRHYSIMTMPTHIILKGGKEISRQSGAMQLPMLLDWLKAYF